MILTDNNVFIAKHTIGHACWQLQKLEISWETRKVKEKIVVTVKYHIETFLSMLIISQNMHMFSCMIIYNIHAAIAYDLNFSKI